MGKNNYFIGVKFNNNKILYEKIVKHKLNNSDLIRKSLEEYFKREELNQKQQDNNYNQDLQLLLQQQSEQYQQHIKDLQNEIDYFQHRLDYFITIKTPIINRLFMKELIPQTTTKKE